MSASVSGVTSTLTYDPAMRLFQDQVTSGSTTRFAYDGVNPIAEYDGSNTLLRRYVDAPGVDQPIVWYEGPMISNATRRFLSSDERGSIISVSDSAGAKLAINTYDEYGIPAFGNLANQRFGYTGQMWLPEVGLYSYKARVYSPTLGRFMQTDPIGFGGGMNIYGYAGNDPLNFIDPLGAAMVYIQYETCVGGDAWTDPGTGQYFPAVWSCGWGGNWVDLPDSATEYQFGATVGSVDAIEQRLTLAPRNRTCTSARGNVGSFMVDRVADAHGSIFAAGSSSAKIAGNTADAEAIASAGVPGALVLGGLSEGIAAVNDYRNGMSTGRAAAIHGSGAVVGFIGGDLGITGGFAAGEALFPAGGGIVGAIFGGILGGVGRKQRG